MVVDEPGESLERGLLTDLLQNITVTGKMGGGGEGQSHSLDNYLGKLAY